MIKEFAERETTAPTIGAVVEKDLKGFVAFVKKVESYTKPHRQITWRMAALTQTLAIGWKFQLQEQGETPTKIKRKLETLQDFYEWMRQEKGLDLYGNDNPCTLALQNLPRPRHSKAPRRGRKSQDEIAEAAARYATAEAEATEQEGKKGRAAA